MMPLTGTQLMQNVDNELRRWAAGDRAPSPPPLPPRRLPLSSVTPYPDEPVIGQRTDVELSEQVRDQIRGCRAKEEFERRSSSLLAQQGPIIPFRPDPEIASQPSPTSNPDSVTSDNVRPEEYTDLYGFIVFAFVGVFFILIGREAAGGNSRRDLAFGLLCYFLASCMGVGAVKILQDWKFPPPEKRYTELHLVLKEMKRTVIQTGKHKQDFCQGLDRIVDLDRHLQRMDRGGAIEANGRDWQRWGRLRGRYEDLQGYIPPRDLEIPSSQQGAEETGDGLDMIM